MNKIWKFSTYKEKHWYLLKWNKSSGNCKMHKPRKEEICKNMKNFSNIYGIRVRQFKKNEIIWFLRLAYIKMDRNVYCLEDVSVPPLYYKKKKYDICCSVAKSCMTLCSPWTAAVGLSYPSLSLRACSNSCPLSSWCHPTVSSSVAPFSSCSQSFPPSESFPMSWLFFFFKLVGS